MLANDFIGFHTKEYCDNYLEALQEWFPVEIRVKNHFYEIIYQGQVTTIGAFPIGLDVDRILSEVSEDKTLEHKVNGEELHQTIRRNRRDGKYIFGGLERCDYTKGLMERGFIFQHALGKLRATGRDACFYQVTSPSRMDNPDYQRLNDILSQEISRLNNNLEGKPLVHLNQGIPAPQNYRFMKEIELMLVTPLEDGMNLVAFEYILSQKYKRPEERGMLVLSTSGASRVLKERGFGEDDGVIFVDPVKPKAAADKLVRALDGGKRLSEAIIGYVENERRVDSWAEKNIDAILQSRKTVA